MVIGLQIRKLREAKHMTVGELARQAGISKGTLSRIERGLIPSPRHSTLQMLARALDLPLERIVGEEGQIVFQGDGVTPYVIAKAVERLPGPEREEIFYLILDRLQRKASRPLTMQSGRSGAPGSGLVAIAGAL